MTAPQDSSFDLNDFQGCNSPKRIYLFLPARVGSSMVEQRPFKALVEGSSPSQPTFHFHHPPYLLALRAY